MFCLLAFVLVSASSVFAEYSSFDGDHKIQLKKHVTLEWSYDETNITMKLTAPTTGWIGIGFSPNGTMAGADLIIAGVRGDSGYILDTYATKNGAPTVDKHQDVEGLEYYQKDKETTVVMRRRLITYDGFDRFIKPGKIKLIWAYGTRIDVNGNPAFYNYHLWRRGMKEVELISMSDTSKTVHETELHHGVTLKWYHTDEDITFEYSAPTFGWVGIGFAPGKTMAGADIIMGGCSDIKREDYVFDGYAIKNGVPEIDEKQDVELLMVKKEFGRTTIKCRRKLYTGDSNDMAITAGEMSIIWAYGILDASSGPSFIKYHLFNRGSKNVVLVSKMPSIDDDDGLEPDKNAIDKNSNEAKTFVLDKTREVNLVWSIGVDKARFMLSARTQGWVGLGFNSEPNMAGADLVIGYYDSVQKQSVIVDAYARANEVPTVDVSSDVELVRLIRDNNSTILTFDRKILSADWQDRSLQKTGIYVLWAYGSEDPMGTLSDSNYHGSNRGAVWLDLMNS